MGKEAMSALGMAFHSEATKVPFHFLLMFWYEGDSFSWCRERFISIPGFAWEVRWIRVVGAWGLENVMESDTLSYMGGVGGISDMTPVVPTS